MKVAVGSTNPVKVKATKKAFEKIWSDKKWTVIAVEGKSGVSDQPMSDEESIKGARNRAKSAMKKTGADFAVGIEGGLQEFQRNWFDTGWIIVIDKKGNEGIGTTIRMQTPPKMMKLVKKGIEVGIVDDMLFKEKGSKTKQGHFGLMTNNKLNREQAYQNGVISALVRFLKPHLFQR